MIDIKVIASGSKGNCTAVKFDAGTILLDAGINFDRIQQALNFENPKAVLITHEHCDHANKYAVAELLKRGVEIYMTSDTAEALKLESRHNLKIITSKVLYDVDIENHVGFYASPAVHDAAEPVYFTVNFNTENVRYIIDNNYLPEFISLPNYLIIEANHSVEAIEHSPIDSVQKSRIIANHLSIDKVLAHIENNLSPRLKEIHLVHVSKRHGDGEKFKQMVENIVGAKIKVFVH